VPTRKQRRRQAKERRHEYEYVYVDDDGNEVEVDPEEDTETPARPMTAKPTKAAATKKPQARGRQATARGGRKVDPPSWQRVLRRGAIFAPVMLLVIYFLKPKSASAATILVQFAVLLLLFLPFSYYMDTLLYRQYRKRIGDPLPPRERKPRAR
jgi:hypothetical protein